MHLEKKFMMVLATLILLMAIYFAQLIIMTDNLGKDKAEMAHLILGWLFGLSNSAVGYYFLSSKSSREKTEMMRDIILPTDVRQISEIRENEHDRREVREDKKEVREQAKANRNKKGAK